MLPKDYVRLRLTGEWATDVADASGTLLLDVARRTWSSDVLDSARPPTRVAPTGPRVPERLGARCVRSRRDGEADARPLAALAGVPVAAGAGDCAAAAVGVGAIEPGVLSIVLGTSGVVFATLPAYAADERARVHAFCHALPDTWHAMGVMLSAAGSLQWFHDALARDVSFSTLLAEAEAWAPGSGRAAVRAVPRRASERRTPTLTREALSSGSSCDTTAARSFAPCSRVSLSVSPTRTTCSATSGSSANRALISGGGARSGLWPKIVASVLEVPITSTAADEGSAFGAALLGGVAGGCSPTSRRRSRRCVHARRDVRARSRLDRHLPQRAQRASRSCIPHSTR